MAELEVARAVRVFADVITGARANSLGPISARGYMRAEDVLLATRLDRMGRATLGTIEAPRGTW
ncbi:hypothetical protein [Falsarthrobacter nasiphocae]|uniref:Uncharacterized protein n=1 Tax=Falsarthrobacter nasiphocae TaxID=189863 RepID=A0AAE4C8I5_9MICC|nr:hypothetical protein [Falsarthrobacter nasiphocae]